MLSITGGKAGVPVWRFSIRMLRQERAAPMTHPAERQKMAQVPFAPSRDID